MKNKESKLREKNGRWPKSRFIQRLKDKILW